MGLTKSVYQVIKALEDDIEDMSDWNRDQYRDWLKEYLTELEEKDGSLAQGLVHALETYLEK